MLVLCSNGISSQALSEKLRKFLSEQGKAALVVTADHEYKEQNYHVQRCTDELRQLGLSVDIFDIDRQDAKQLLSYDLVEFIGGNPFYLLHSIREHNCMKIIQELAKHRILVGWSAAVFVFSPTLELVHMYSPELNFMKLTDLSGLHLTDLQVLPHYQKFLKRFEFFEQRCRQYEQLHHTNVIRLNDGEGIFIAHEKVEIVRISSQEVIYEHSV